MQLRCQRCSQPLNLGDIKSLLEDRCCACNQPLELDAGSRSIGDYVLIDKLGTGGFGSVWRASDTDGREIALKILSKNEFDSHDWLHVLREARAACQLKHPNIVRIYDIGSDDEHRFIAGQCVVGVDLKRWRNRTQGLTERRIARLMGDVADAVHYAHEMGIIHRDLKPYNIMVDATDHPYLIDFGLSLGATDDELQKFERYRMAHFLMSGVRTSEKSKLVGTPLYMSPEQAAGLAEIDHRTDIYSLGAVLYEMLTGRRPFLGKGKQLLRRIINRAAVPPARVNPQITPAMEKICLKAMNKNPEQRFETAGEFRDELRYLAETLADDVNLDGDQPTSWLVRTFAPWLAPVESPTSSQSSQSTQGP